MKVELLESIRSEDASVFLLVLDSGTPVASAAVALFVCAGPKTTGHAWTCVQRGRKQRRTEELLAMRSEIGRQEELTGFNERRDGVPEVEASDDVVYVEANSHGGTRVKKSQPLKGRESIRRYSDDQLKGTQDPRSWAENIKGHLNLF